jgi:uncharacterized protein (DUF3084 family)
MSTVTRDEFETVKELLVSAARYAELANQKLAQVATQQQVNTQAIGEISQQQNRTQQQLDQLSVRVTQLSERIDSFVFESQRLITGQAERVDRLEGISERLEAILAYLVRKEGTGN